MLSLVWYYDGKSEGSSFCRWRLSAGSFAGHRVNDRQWLEIMDSYQLEALLFPLILRPPHVRCLPNLPRPVPHHLGIRSRPRPSAVNRAASSSDAQRWASRYGEGGYHINENTDDEMGL